MKYVCLPDEWENYIYRTVSLNKLQAKLLRMTIVDMCTTDHGVAMRARYIPTQERPADPDCPVHEIIAHIYAEGEEIAAEIADMEKDRLPGYPANETGGVVL